MLALLIGKLRGTIDEAYYHEVASALLALPDTIRQVLETAPEVEKLSRIFT